MPAVPEQGPEQGRRRGAYAKGIARRQEILDRAIEVFADRGADGASLRAIAERIGVSHATLLHYFDSREQLLVAVFRASEEKLSAAHPAPSGLGAVGGLTHAARRNHTVPGLVRLYSTLVASALEEGHPDAREHFEARFGTLRDRLAEQVVLDQEKGAIRPGLDPHVVASLVIGASDGLQIQWLLDAEITMEPALEMLEELLRP